VSGDKLYEGSILPNSMGSGQKPHRFLSLPRFPAIDHAAEKLVSVLKKAEGFLISK